jgi:general secretion pathway protein I
MKNNAGFTLIEVLIALAILSIALTAIIKSTSQNIKDTAYIQTKTIATWVGTQAINEARVGITTFPLSPAKLSQETEMLGRKWTWEGSMSPTPNIHIKKINVTVFDQTHHQISQLNSYVYVP